MVGGERAISQKLPDKIIDYILRNNVEGRFDSALHFGSNFAEHIQRLTKERQMMVFYDGEEITGVCGWMLVDDYKKINKLRWETPENIKDGRTLYVTMCVLDKKNSLFQVKRKFEEMGYRDKIDRIYWINSIRGETFNKGVIK